MSSGATDGSNVLALPAVLDLGTAQALRDRFLEACSASEPVVVNAEQVERIGTPAVQVLLSAARTLAVDGRGFSMQRPSQGLCTAFEDLGLIDELKRWSDI